VHPADPPIIDAWDPGAAGGRPDAEMRIRRADTGEERWIARRGELRREGGATGLRFVGVVYDITASKLAEARLREFASQLSQMVESRTQERDRLWNLSGDLFVVCGFDGLYNAANPAWEAILGYPVREVVGRRAGSLVHPEDRDRARLMLEAMQRGESMRDFDCRMLAKDGDYRWISWTGIGQGDEIFATGRDITQKKLLEDQLRQSQKMEAVGQLTGGLAHDFNNMLTGIIGSIDIVRRRLADGRTADLDRFMDAAKASAERAAALTHRLLAFSRRQSLDTRAVEVNHLVDSLADLLTRTLGEQIELEIVLAPDAWPILSDANQLESALLNLAINARDAMPGGGRLTISTRNVAVGADQAARNEVSPGDYTLLSVGDTGAGMEPAVVAKAFDPFFTTKPIGRGTGLGLSMIHGFVHQTGGFVTIDSQVGKGTIVHLYLPRLAGGERREPLPIAGAALRPGEGEAILVVEDDPSVRTLVMEILRDLGYQARIAADADAAMAVLNSAEPVEVLITDVGLPGLNGRQLADYARQRRPGLRVIFMTGYAEGAAVRSEFLEPGMALIAKPFSIEAFAALIGEIVDAGVPEKSPSASAE
jgi:PAS domain S-box-containing protein